MYRRMNDARVTEKGNLVFGDLDHLQETDAEGTLDRHSGYAAGSRD